MVIPVNKIPGIEFIARRTERTNIPISSSLRRRSESS